VKYRFLDVSMTSLGNSGSFLNRLARSSSLVFDWRRLCAIARRSKSRLWGDKYSPDQRLRDNEFCRPMEFGYEAVLIRFHIWDLHSNRKVEDHENVTAKSLLDDIFRLKEVRNTNYFNHLNLVSHSYITPRSTQMFY
jgi:hypothetical protein